MNKLIKTISLILLIGGALSGCKMETKVIREFDESFQDNLTHQGEEYSAEAYENDAVPLKTYIKISGTVSQTDAEDAQSIKKDDRFVIEFDGVSIQIINSTSTTLSLNENVTVYGVYYGFVQAEKITFP